MLNKLKIFQKNIDLGVEYETLTNGSQFQVKRICVLVGAKLSLQSHKHRSEHWVVVEGTAKVTINNKTNVLKAENLLMCH